MKLRKLSAFVALLALLVMQSCNSTDKKAGGTTANGNAVALKFNLQKGKAYTYAMNMEMDGDVQGQKMENDMAFDYTVEVVADQDSLKTLKTTYDRIKMEMNAGPMNIDFDTNEPQKDSAADPRQNPMGMMSNMFYAMKGKSFQMTVNDKGEVKSVTGMEEMMNAMMNSFPAEGNARQAMGQAFQTQFNEEAVKKSFEQAFNIFPNKSVKVGDTWTRTINVGGPAGADVNTVYKVKEINSDNVVLDISGDLNMGGAKGMQTGTLNVNSATGLVTDGVMEQKITSPSAMTIKYTITGKEK